MVDYRFFFFTPLLEDDSIPKGQILWNLTSESDLDLSLLFTSCMTFPKLAQSHFLICKVGIITIACLTEMKLIHIKSFMHKVFYTMFKPFLPILIILVYFLFLPYTVRSLCVKSMLFIYLQY